MRCRKFPFSDLVIVTFKNRNQFHHGVREQLEGLLKKLRQTLLVSKLEVQRIIAEYELVGELIDRSVNVSLVQRSEDGL